MGLKLESAMSGPRSRVELTPITPLLTVPATTVPTPGTAKVSSMMNSGSSDILPNHSYLWGIRFMNCRSRSRPSPVTDDVRKMGAMVSLAMFLAQVMTSSCVLTMIGIFLTPGFFRIACRDFIVLLKMCSGQISILVMTKKLGIFSASAMPFTEKKNERLLSATHRLRSSFQVTHPGAPCTSRSTRGWLR